MRRPMPRRRVATAGSASGWRSCAAWSSCTAGGSLCTATASGLGTTVEVRAAVGRRRHRQPPAARDCAAGCAPTRQRATVSATSGAGAGAGDAAGLAAHSGARRRGRLARVDDGAAAPAGRRGARLRQRRAGAGRGRERQLRSDHQRPRHGRHGRPRVHAPAEAPAGADAGEGDRADRLCRRRASRHGARRRLFAGRGQADLAAAVPRRRGRRARGGAAVRRVK